MRSPGLPILTFHAIDDAGGVTSTPPHRFGEIVGRMVEAGFVGVDLATWTATGRPPVDRGFAITFDDGLRSILSAMPTLERHRLPATVFLVTGHVGSSNDWPGQPRSVPRSATLDWSEVHDLHRRGVRFGAHTDSHPRLDKLRPDRFGREIRASRDAIESRLNHPCGLFAYPYGLASPRVVESVSRNFRAAFGTRLDMAQAGHDGFALPRIDAHYLRSPKVVKRLIEGRLGGWLSVRRGLRTVKRIATAMGSR